MLFDSCVHLHFDACALCISCKPCVQSPWMLFDALCPSTLCSLRTVQPRRCSAAFIHHLCLLLLQVLELFKAADKYDVPGLVKECVQIFRNITHSADVAPLLQVSIAPFSLKHLAVNLSVQVVKQILFHHFPCTCRCKLQKPGIDSLSSHTYSYTVSVVGIAMAIGIERGLLCAHHVQVDMDMCLWYIHKRLLWMM